MKKNILFLLLIQSLALPLQSMEIDDAMDIDQQEGFSALAEELKVHILSFAATAVKLSDVFTELGRLSLVDSSFHRLVDDEVFLK